MRAQLYATTAGKKRPVSISAEPVMIRTDPKVMAEVQYTINISPKVDRYRLRSCFTTGRNIDIF